MKRRLSRPMLMALASIVAAAVPGTGAEGAAVTSAAGVWSIMSVPSPAGAASITLNGISCPSRTLCIAVGGTNLGTLAEEWNGTTWSIQTTPSPASTAVFNSVSCVSVTVCEAVGTTSATGTGALAEVWNGTSWTVQPVPAPGGSWLASVWCTSTTWCTAVGGSNKGPLGEGWNGTIWASQPGLPPPRHQPPNIRLMALLGVWCKSPRSCTAAGHADIIPGPPLLALTYWNGTKWSWSGMYNIGGILNGISCTAKVCIAAGQSASPVPRQHVPSPLAINNPVHGAGGTLTSPPTPHGFSTGVLTGVACRSAVCEAVGTTNLGTLAERWTGTKWSLQHTPNPGSGTGVLKGIACASTTACIAVGNSPLAEAYTG